MYRILLVDDEMPALRFLQAIIGKYAPDFSVCEMCIRDRFYIVGNTGTLEAPIFGRKSF